MAQSTDPSRTPQQRVRFRLAQVANLKGQSLAYAGTLCALYLITGRDATFSHEFVSFDFRLFSHHWFANAGGEAPDNVSYQLPDAVDADGRRKPVTQFDDYRFGPLHTAATNIFFFTLDLPHHTFIVYCQLPSI